MLPFELTKLEKTPHTSPFRASYGVSFMSTSTEIDRVIKGFYCIHISYHILDFVEQKKTKFPMLPILYWCPGELRSKGSADMVLTK